MLASSKIKKHNDAEDALRYSYELYKVKTGNTNPEDPKDMTANTEKLEIRDKVTIEIFDKTDSFSTKPTESWTFFKPNKNVNLAEKVIEIITDRLAATVAKESFLESTYGSNIPQLLKNKVKKQKASYMEAIATIEEITEFEGKKIL